MKDVIKWIAWIIVVIGGLNWGLVGLFNYDIIAMMFGAGSLAANITYDIVGLAAVVLIIYKIMRMGKKK